MDIWRESDNNRMRAGHLLSLALGIVTIIGILHGVVSLCSQIFSLQNDSPVQKTVMADNRKHVLFVSAFDNLLGSTETQIKGLKKVFDSFDVDFDSFSMDIIFYDDPSLEMSKNLFARRIERQMPIDVIIFGDEEALSFGESIQKDVLKDIPIFFLGVTNDVHAEEAAKNPYISGCVEKSYLKETIELGMRFFPMARKVVAIFDDSGAGKIRQKEFFALKDSYPGYLFRGLNTSEISRDIFRKRLHMLESDTILISLENGEDANGNKYSPLENIKFISKNTSIPVFTNDIAAIGKGFLGGKVIDYEEAGMLTALSIMDSLNGLIDISATPMFNTADANYVIDSNVMRRYNLNPNLLPADTIFVNRARDYLKHYKNIIIPVIQIMFFLLVLLLILIKYLLELRKSRQKILYNSLHDPLTGLPKLDILSKKIEDAMARKIKFAVVSIDISDFDIINDSNSYKCGDFVIKELGDRLSSLSKEGNYEVARVMGPRFMLLYLTGHFEEKDPEIYFLRQLIGNEIEFKDKSLFLMTNMGIVNSNALFSVEDYIKNSDIALHESKKLGKNKSCFYTDEIKQQIKENTEISTALENACKEEAFSVLFQPQIDVRTGKIHAFEALVRLQSTRISPALFIPVAERDGHIAKIGRIVTEKVIKQMAEWRDAGVELYRVSINFSAAQIGDKGYIPFLRKLLCDYKIPSELIGIEITESLFLGNKSEAAELFNEFDELGIKISLDDFGTGYSSINYLTYLPIENVKLDKSTVDIYLDGKADFIRNVVNLVHSLGMKITIEGVEDMWQYEKLKSFDCDFIQGYFFSKPLTGEEIKTFTPAVLST